MAGLTVLKLADTIQSGGILCLELNYSYTALHNCPTILTCLAEAVESTISELGGASAVAVTETEN